MRRYETIVIIDPDLSNEQRLPVFERLKDLIVQQGGFLVIVDEWGDKRLAYEIKKRSRGYYVRLDFCGTGALVNEMERFFRIDERVLKYMTVLLDKDADVEKIKERMAEAEASKEQMAEAEASKEQTAQDTTASDDESTAATNDKLNDSEPEDKQDQPEISESQAVESETTQTESNEEEK
ncbi:MAG: 30S ribosomal protein S6 [Desulfobacterales bacterium]